MKFYETHFEEYCKAVDAYNYHPEIEPPKCNQVADMPNQIFYGPTGCGKYSQVLRWIRPFSPSKLKYDHRMTAVTDKMSYIYRISDIHYEVDIAMLGCNSKIIWETVFNQITDIVSVRADKSAIIVCKNFHAVHNELLEIFYSYMRQYQKRNLLFNKNNICIKYVLITEHLSFIPDSILRECQIQTVRRPSLENLMHGRTPNVCRLLRQVETDGIVNLKEIEAFHHIGPLGGLPGGPGQEPLQDVPCDIFNKICNAVLHEIRCITPDRTAFDFMGFRDLLYNISIYHLDVLEALTYILVNAIQEDLIRDADVKDILHEIVTFLRYYNNNYRTIYHIERIFVYIVTKRFSVGGGGLLSHVPETRS